MSDNAIPSNWFMRLVAYIQRKLGWWNEPMPRSDEDKPNQDPKRRGGW